MIPLQLPLSHPTFLLSFILILISSLSSSLQVCNHKDQAALLAFSANISTISLSLPLNWSSGVSCCEWEGVECNLDGRVTHLQLTSRSLIGVINISCISDLLMLTHLNLSKNSLNGSLSQDIAKLKHLRVVDLSGNNMSGSIPQEIGKLSQLRKLHLDENNLSGPIPPSLMNCTHLEEIILGYNLINGDISSLDFSNLVHLLKLDLVHNSLNGTLPESLYSCKSLIAVRIADNNITGQISPKIAQLRSLSFLSLTDNSLTNITMALRVLANCKNLTSLFLSSNFHGESLPIHQNFTTVGEFPKLQFFSLSICLFEPGPIPNWLSNIKSLRALAMNDNNLIGQVPNWLGTLPNLFFLVLSENGLSGELPLSLCQLPGLISENAQADLNSSEFELPIYLLASTMTKMENIRFKASFYREISFSRNSLSGHIPEEIGNLKNLQRLKLAGNQFSGHIPATISKLTNLERLDLSENNLTGRIPTSLVSLHFLSLFDVSSNDLHGPIPTGGQFGAFDESDFANNPGLCGEPLNKTCSSSTPKISDTNATHSSHDRIDRFLNGLYVGFASGFSVVLIFIASYVWYHNSGRRFQSGN